VSPPLPAAPPGVALERTTMAWLRTILALTVVALLFLRFQEDGLPVVVLSLAGVAAAWGLGLVQWLRHPARMRTYDAGTVRPERDAARFLTAFVILLAAGGLLVVLL
jgi:uncharacterized membrane protein YidH (DUF202 family)